MVGKGLTDSPSKCTERAEAPGARAHQVTVLDSPLVGPDAEGLTGSSGDPGQVWPSGGCLPVPHRGRWDQGSE